MNWVYVERIFLEMVSIIDFVDKENRFMEGHKSFVLNDGGC